MLINIVIIQKGPPQESSRKRKQKEEPIIYPDEKASFIIGSYEKNTSSSSSYRPIKFTIQPNFTNLPTQCNHYGSYNTRNTMEDKSSSDFYFNNEDEDASHIPFKKRSLAVVSKPGTKDPISSVATSNLSETSSASSSILGSSIKVLAAAAAVFRDLEGKTRVGSL